MNSYSIPRLQLDALKRLAKPGKVVLIYGSRRVGKTTLLQKFLEEENGDYLFVSGEDIRVREPLSSQSIDRLKEFVGNKNLVVIDEAQNIPNIGLNLKLMVDHIPHIRIVATGSSSFDLQKHVGEPLTGRSSVLYLYPISQLELKELETRHQTEGYLESRLIYGAYPEVITTNGEREKESYLHGLVSSYLFKDILAFEGIHKSQKLIDLLVLVAFQIGQEVSLSELATQLSISKQSVEKYLDILGKVFILYNVRGFSRNLRKEVTKTSRYYFYDNGIRNALINNFNPLKIRNDVGALWENYLVMERLKKQQYTPIWSRNFFWRTYDGQEIDWVEEREGKLFGYEFKYGNREPQAPKAWIMNYPQATYECISRSNYLPFIS